MTKIHLQAPKGTRDITGSEIKYFRQLEEVSRRVFEQASFSEIQTPMFEMVELFSRGLGATSDVVQKEMFSFSDRGERDYALRPEGTAGVVRHYIENSLWGKGGQHRFYYVGPMFRGERPQAGRYRQFWQIGSEWFGSKEPSADADTIFLVNNIFIAFGLTDFQIHINSLGCSVCRGAYRTALLDYLLAHQDLLSEESKSRMTQNPLRVLDSKEDGPKLNDAPTMTDHLCSDCAIHYSRVKLYLEPLSSKLFENPKLVRGLDYYSRTVFEFVSPHLGAQSALAAGGRYDALVELLGGVSTPGVGFALGMDRLVMAKTAIEQKHQAVSLSKKTCVIVPMGEEESLLSFRLSHSLRQEGFVVPPIDDKRKLKNQISFAVDIGAKWAILIGGDEVAGEFYTLKNLETREQVKVPLSGLVEYLKNHS